MATYADEERERQLNALLETFFTMNKRKLDWHELEDSITESGYDTMSPEEQQEFLWFLCHACLRVWSAPEVLPLNTVTEDKSGFMIKNYDWKSYRWAKKKGVPEEMFLANIIGVPFSVLDGKETNWLRAKVK